jgi:hypothetical protein
MILLPTGQVWPCPECGGTGVEHCCDGLQAQPEPPPAPPPDEEDTSED